MKEINQFKYAALVIWVRGRGNGGVLLIYLRELSMGRGKEVRVARKSGRREIAMKSDQFVGSQGLDYSLVRRRGGFGNRAKIERQVTEYHPNTSVNKHPSKYFVLIFFLFVT